MGRYGIKYCTVGDNCYPRVLRKIANRPAVLYYKGNITILNERHNLAVIGGRRCSKKAEELAFMTGEYSICSGLKKYQYVERDRLQSGVSDGVLVVEAERESGTMHTVEYAKQQYRRLACYCNALFAIEKATGNQYIQENSRAQIINNTNDLNIFLNDIAQEPYYEQMSLFD